jgi:uncharacterized protein YjbJ (UPF0337 family)
MLVTREELEGQWHQVKGRLQNRWGQLTDDELQQARGSSEELVGMIEEKTGESRRAIEDYLEEILTDGSSAVQAATETVRQYAHHAADAAHVGYDQAAASVRAGYEQAEGMIRSKPAESIAVAFGAGLITGIILGLVMKSR